MTSPPAPTAPDPGPPFAGFAKDPLSYPGPVTQSSVLLVPGSTRNSIRQLTERDLAGCLAAGDLVAVAAVGSNASPAVLQHKLGGLGTVPMVVASLAGVRVAPSAHVSRPGFVPAAPAAQAPAAHDPGAPARVVIGWLTSTQLARIDATEPNYRRIRLPASEYPLAPELGPNPAAVEVYESLWGVLPMDLRSQAELAAELAALGLTPWTTRSPAEAARTLATSSSIRAEAQRAFVAAGLVRPSGLRPL